MKSIPLNLSQNNFVESFTLARLLKRHHHFYLGPTNSGKTHHALIALQNAESGVYLAPLRLLAMEIRDRLVAAGVPCNLITGEERVMMNGARHTASTIEMMNPGKSVEVAIIDEIQMLQDPERGSAWTAALIGVPAKFIFVCGSNAVTAPCIAAIEAMNETHEITYLARMTPLVLENESICGSRYSRQKLKPKLQKGDAVIAFSRKDVLTFSARFRQWGFAVASIYGALSPEVRRTESTRFCTGEADILVATDAIGMGLNLPIRRVIFSNIHKFDGVASRYLNATEVRQIAGRAGRFGIYPTGYVSVLENDELIHIEHMLHTDDTAELTKLPINISFKQIGDISEKLHTRKIAEVLDFHQMRTKFNSELFAQTSLSNQISQAVLVDNHAPDMSLKDKYIFVCAPISLNVAFEKDYYLLCLQSVAQSQKRHLPTPPVWLESVSPKYLEAAELLSHNLSLYAWLSFKFPQIFVDGEQVKTLRQRVSRYIENALLTQAGFGDTTRETDYLMTKRKY
ncbi:MAG: SUV3 C-terminal domain-containing protein [Methylotenera sp.]|uniref:helicase-related protein n=1 Tax=Methylotenera sp. TaxID=2051956 RepID=UPI00271BA9F1|nr:helicase-related protein [Methylotenera sp.]MDO9394211.1 SUV3 C-terminal domain-containing protein [Methylotenera sp.]MDP1521955.1 SUV3 C-terminal domain-containing protein [Methylotenera sp.]MDP3309099.1 SUV3 C-terminal domain-containing protein [Methylotenera sp.]